MLEDTQAETTITTSRPKKVLTPISLTKTEATEQFRRDVNEFDPTPKIIHKTEPNQLFELIHNHQKY